MTQRAPRRRAAKPPAPQAAAPDPGGRDPFALDIDDLLKETPEVAPSASVWERIEAALPGAPKPGGGRRREG